MKAKEINFQFEIKRPSRSHRQARVLFLVSFLIATLTLFGYIPFVTYQQDIIALENINRNLSNQLDVVQAEQSIFDEFTTQEILYNNAYTYLSDLQIPLQTYITSIFDSSVGLVNISSYEVDSLTSTITIVIYDYTEAKLNEFILQIYEDYGLIENQETLTRWILAQPSRTNLNSSRVEVSFNYA